MPLKPQILIIATLAVIVLEGSYIAHRFLATDPEPEAASGTPYAAADVDDDFFTSSIKVINGGDSSQPMPPAIDRLAQAGPTIIPTEPGLPQTVAPAGPMAPAPVAVPVAQAPPPAPAPVVDAVAPTAPAAAAPGVPVVDETALRYFARQGDDRRLNAEIARLKSLYPQWVPPDNLNAPAPISDPLLDQMWKLYGDGQYAAVRAAIADRISRQPQWTPPADLLRRLDVGEARERLINASNAKQWNTVVAVAAATPSLLTCADVDILWRLAEAFGMSNRTLRSRDVDIYILNNCQNPKERLATVQKAMAVLADAELDELLKLERKGIDGQGEFEPVKADIARRHVGAGARDPKIAVSQGDLDLLAQLARDGDTAPDPLTLGEYWFAHDDPAKAVDWFAMAKSRADNAEIARGYAYTLNALKRPANAEAAAYKWRDAGDDNKKAYLVVATSLLSMDPPVKLDPDVLKRLSLAISDAKYGPGAQELGWYAYKIGQVPIAVRWFGMAESLMPDDEPSAYGLALSYDRLKDRAGLSKVLRAWSARSPRIADLANPPNRRKRVISKPDDANVPLESRAAVPSSPADQAAAAPASYLDAEQEQPVRRRAAAPVQREAVEYVDAPLQRPAANSQRRAARTAAPQAGSNGRSSCAGNVMPEQLSAMSALNRGWCLMNLNRPIEAANAFDAAGKAGTGQVVQDAAYGKTLAYLRAGLTDSAAASAAESQQAAGRTVELRTAIITQRAIAAYNDDRFVETLLALDDRAQIAPEQNDLLMMRGWCYFHLRRYPEAKRIWVAVAGTGSRDAQRALAVLNEQTKIR